MRLGELLEKANGDAKELSRARRASWIRGTYLLRPSGLTPAFTAQELTASDWVIEPRCWRLAASLMGRRWYWAGPDMLSTEIWYAFETHRAAADKLNSLPYDMEVAFEVEEVP